MDRQALIWVRDEQHAERRSDRCGGTGMNNFQTALQTGACELANEKKVAPEPK
jgi:hypothetical protein